MIINIENMKDNDKNIWEPTKKTLTINQSKDWKYTFHHTQTQHRKETKSIELIKKIIMEPQENQQFNRTKINTENKKKTPSIENKEIKDENAWK